MPVKFDFVSPGIQLREIDQSFLEPVPEEDGLLLVGRARRGPAMRVIKVNSLNAFVDVFGNPMDGVRQADPWRQGNTGAPNYAAYAAQAYLAAGIGPVKYIRLLGKQKDGSAATDANKAGWNMKPTNADDSEFTSGVTVDSVNGALGLFIFPSGNANLSYAVRDDAIQFNSTGAVGEYINFTGSALAMNLNGKSAFRIEIAKERTVGGAGNPIAASDCIWVTQADGVTWTAEIIRDLFKKALEGGSDARIMYGTGIGGQGTFGGASNFSGLGCGLTPEDGGSGAAYLKLTSKLPGLVGNEFTYDEEAGATVGVALTSPLQGGLNADVTGTLAAILYVNSASFGISGTKVEGGTDIDCSTLIINSDDNFGFDLCLSSSITEQQFTASVNFDPSSPSYIRNVLNTDPTLVLADKNYADSVTSSVGATPYFLGETFDVNMSYMTGGGTGTAYGMILGLDGGTDHGGMFDDHRMEMQAARTGWFIGPQPSQKKLFYLTALSEGSEMQKDFYVTITDIKMATTVNPRASFTLNIVERIGAKGTIVEKFSNVTLDPTDDDYIIKRIGDVHETWDATANKFSLSGLYPNRSDYVRVTVASAGLNASDVPVGFVGPKVPGSVAISGSNGADFVQWVKGKDKVAYSNNSAQTTLFVGAPYVTCSIAWPKMKLTEQSTNGPQSLDYQFSDMFGLRHVRKQKTANSPSFGDLAHRRVAVNPFLDEAEALAAASFIFTLDDIVSGSTTATRYYFKANTYANTIGSEESISKRYGLSGTNGLIEGLRIRQFAAPFFGGADGVNVKYADPFSNERIGLGVGKYPEYTVNEALDMIEDPDNVRYELVSVPGLINDTLTEKLMNMSADRGDNLAIVDFSGIYRPSYDRADTSQAANKQTMIDKIDSQGVDNSYAATYYPNIRARDTLNGNDTVLVLPPSVAAIGAIAKSEALSQPWFAPAGFNRGGLGRLGGSAGPIVVGTVEHLTKADRDVLYASHINPIARFPATGDTVIFGQRTLQQGASALDRINVRRLMIYLKRRIGDIADTILFDQNLEATWNRFKARADEVLSEVKTDLGITEYKLVLDSSTTTPDLIDRNIMYAKIFIKPARAIEFIAIDFIITRTGVEFE